MNKIFFLLLGMHFGLIAMDPPERQEGDKQKGHRELIQRNALSSGSVAPSSSVPKITSTSTVTSGGGRTSDSSSGDSDLAQLELDKDGHGYQLHAASSMRRRIKVKVAADSHDDDILKQLVLAKQQADAANTELRRLATAAEKQKKRDSMILSFDQVHIPALPLADLEKGNRQTQITHEEIDDMIAGIKEATELDITKITDALKEEIRTLCETPTDSPRFKEKERIITALTHMRQCTSQRAKQTSRIETLKRRPNTPEDVRESLRAQKITEIFEDLGINSEDMNRAFKDLVHSTTANKLERIDTVKGRWKLGSIVTTLIAIAGWSVTVYSQSKGGSHSSTPTCAPFNATM